MSDEVLVKLNEIAKIVTCKKKNPNSLDLSWPSKDISRFCQSSKTEL